MALNEHRARVVDYTVPFWYGQQVVLYKMPSNQGQWGSLMYINTFKPTLWLAVGISTILVGLIIMLTVVCLTKWFADKIDVTYVSHMVQMSCGYSIKALLFQGM